MTTLEHEQLLAQSGRIDQVAVVPQRQTIRRVDIQRLRLIRTIAAGGRVTHMADTDVADQGIDIALPEHIVGQAVASMQVHAIVFQRGDAGGILTTMLLDGHGVKQAVGHRLLADDAYDAAHVLIIG